MKKCSGISGALLLLMVASGCSDPAPTATKANVVADDVVVHNVRNQDCVEHAERIASEVIINIKAGRNDFFENVDLDRYKGKRCDPALIDSEVKRKVDSLDI